jgi:hypothetical protein
MQTSRAQTSRHAGASPASRTNARSSNWQDAAFWARTVVVRIHGGQLAVAHGCGPALVQRVTRVGTGWRLWARSNRTVGTLPLGPTTGRPL